MTKAEISKNLRWKRPALEELSYQSIIDKLYEIAETCEEIRWEYSDDDELIDALDGNEDEAFEFKMLFSTLASEAEQLLDCLNDWIVDDSEREFNDTSVALIGNRFKQVGYDGYQEDYFALTAYEANLAFSAAGERLMKKTKKEMITSIGRTMGVIFAFYNVELKYDYLHATIDILKDRNKSFIKQIKKIEEAYEAAQAETWDGKASHAFEKLLKDLPEQFWIW